MRKVTDGMTRGSTRNYRNLDVWNVAMELTVAVYALAGRLPKDERFELSAQVRRAAVSVPSNIAEGHSTGMDGLLLRHLRIAQGSVGELETQVELSVRLGFLSVGEVKQVVEQLARTGQLLNGLIRSLRARRRLQKAGAVSLLCLISWLRSLLSLRRGCPLRAYRLGSLSYFGDSVRTFSSCNFVLARIDVVVFAHAFTRGSSSPHVQRCIL